MNKMLPFYNSPPDLLCCAQVQVTQKLVGGGGGVCVEEWMKRICPCYTPSRIALAEGARETVSLRGTLSARFFFFFFFFFKQETVRHPPYKIFT